MLYIALIIGYASILGAIGALFGFNAVETGVKGTLYTFLFGFAVLFLLILKVLIVG